MSFERHISSGSNLKTSLIKVYPVQNLILNPLNLDAQNNQIVNSVIPLYTYQAVRLYEH